MKQKSLRKPEENMCYMEHYIDKLLKKKLSY